MRETPDKLDYSENVGIALSQNLVGPTAAATLTLYSVDSINVKGEDDGVADAPEVAQGSSADDDLTSLTWLQDKNLLKGVRQLPKNEASKKVASCSTVIPTESASIKTTAESSSVVCTMSSKPKDEQTPFSYDPQIHTNSKPPFSFSCLIFMAIEDSPSKALPVKDIYVWIVDHFPYYNNAPTGWKNSVRHNLSLNKCFKKVDKAPNLGKGSLWMVEQRFRPSLINALQKSPYQYIKFIRNFKLNTEPKKLSNSSVKNEIIVDAQHVNEVCSSANTTIVNEEVPVYARDPIEIYKSDEIRFGTENFEDVDAAAAMLVLKHGGYAFNITPDCINLAIANTYQPSANQYVINEEEKPLVTSYPSEDHNYVYDDSVPTNVSVLAVNDYLGNTEEITTTTNIDAEEQRKIAEGADALLNLAGIRTYNTRKRYASSSEESVGAIQQYGKRSKIAQQVQQHTPPVLSSYHKAIKTTDSAESDYDCDNIRNGVSTLERSCGKRRRRVNSCGLYSGTITDGTASDEDEEGSNGETNEDDDDDTETASDEEANFPAVDSHNSRKMVQRKNAKALKKVSLRRTRRTSKSLDVVTNAPTATSTVTVAAKYRGRKVKY